MEIKLELSRHCISNTLCCVLEYAMSILITYSAVTVYMHHHGAVNPGGIAPCALQASCTVDVKDNKELHTTHT